MLKKMKKMWILTLLVVTFLIIQIVALNRGLSSRRGEKSYDELYGEIYFVSNRTDKSKELNELIKEFEDMHPNVHVNLELMGDVEEILERKAAVGDLPDVTLIPASIDKNQLSKYLLPIDDLGFNKDNIYNYMSGLGSDNVLYSVTTSIIWNGVIYNKSIFKSQGIDKNPVNEEEFFNICSKIKKNDIIPIALNYRQSWVTNMWINIVPYLYDPEIEDKLIEEPIDILSEDGEIYKSLNFAKKIYSYGYCEDDIVNYDWAQCKEDIINGKISMIIWNSNFINQLIDMGMNKDSLGMFPIPGTDIIEIDGDYRFGISKNTRYPDAAKEFLKFMFEDDRYANAVNTISSMKESEDTKKMIGELSKFNMPIIFQEDIIPQNDKAIAIHERYTYLKKNIGLNYKFVQNYITSSDTKQIEESINNRWLMNKKLEE